MKWGLLSGAQSQTHCGNYYNKSLRALKRMNTMMTKMALVGPRRAAK